MTLCSTEIEDTAITFPEVEPLQLAVDTISREWNIAHAEGERKKWLDGLLFPLWDSMKKGNGSVSNGTTGVGSGIARSLAVTVSGRNIQFSTIVKF